MLTLFTKGIRMLWKKAGLFKYKAIIRTWDVTQAFRKKKNDTSLLLIWSSCTVIQVWPHKVRHSPAPNELGGSDVSLTSIQRGQSFLVLHFPLTIKCIPFNLPGRVPSPAFLHLLRASYTTKSISCLTLCLLLNSVCTETQTTWATVCPGTR